MYKKIHPAFVLIPALLEILNIGYVMAEIRDSNTPMIRTRIGSNDNTVNTVVYNAGIPAQMNGLPGVTAVDEAESTTSIPGGSGVYRVRIVTDINARSGLPAPLTGIFAYDSSSPMICTTTSTCDGTSIPFTKIRWNTRDGDTLNTVLNYDGSANQVFKIQTDTNPSNGGNDTRHRNYYQFIFDNDTLYPAGTYEGTISINGSAQ